MRRLRSAEAVGSAASAFGGVPLVVLDSAVGSVQLDSEVPASVRGAAAWDGALVVSDGADQVSDGADQAWAGRDVHGDQDGVGDGGSPSLQALPQATMRPAIPTIVALLGTAING